MVFNIKKLRFRTRISLGFGFILAISILSNIIAIRQLYLISEQSDLIYHHPFKVSNSVRDINTYINSIHLCLKDLITAEDKKEINKLEREIFNYKDLFEESIHIVSSKYLGDAASVEDVSNAFYYCNYLASNVIYYKKIGEVDSANKIVENDFTQNKTILLKKTKVLTTFAENKANDFYSSLKTKRKKSISQLLFVVLNLFLFTILLILFLSNNISKPIIRFISKSKKIIHEESEREIDTEKLSEEDLLEFIDDELHRVYKENKSVLEATMNNSPAGILLSDAKTNKIKYVNKSGNALTKNSYINIKDAVNSYGSQRHLQILHLNEDPYEYEDLPHIKAVKTGKHVNEELILKINNKENKFLWVNAAPIFNDKKEITAGIVIILDITEQKKTLKDLKLQINKFSLLNNRYKNLNQELTLSKQKAEEINRLKSSFMATMSHELRTPLNTVIGLSQIIDTDMDNSEIMEMTKLINKNGNQLLDIIESIFDLTLIQAGEYTVKKEIFSVKDLCTEFSYYFKSEIVARNKSHLKAKFCVDNYCADVKINTDLSKLRKLLQHILINAIKFTEKGEIECSYTVIDNTITFSVRDTGPGIDSSLLDAIFDKFNQADNSNTRKFGGIGLGLATCKEISRLLNGELMVESEKNKGTTFHFKLTDVIV